MSATHLQETPVPGSLVLFDFAADATHEVVLSPKPSNDVNDPLNWSWKRKQIAHLMLVVCES
jgi:H2-forming N5,N10-methylenetetrahydromethanopterin dehydrogenase-like enzyme